MFKYLFTNVWELDEEELEKANKVMQKVADLLCSMDYHDLVEDDSEIFCLNCSAKFPQQKKNNLITNFLWNRYREIGLEWFEFNNPYSSY